MYCVVLTAITVHYSSFKPSFDFNNVIGIEDIREERSRNSNGNSSFRFFKAYQGQKIQGYNQIDLRHENQSYDGQILYVCRKESWVWK